MISGLDFMGPRLVELERGTRTADLLGRVVSPPALGAEAMARIQQRILGESRRVFVRRARVRWWAFASLGVAGAAGAATVADRVLLRPQTVIIAPERTKPARSGARGRGKDVKGPVALAPSQPGPVEVFDLAMLDSLPAVALAPARRVQRRRMEPAQAGAATPSSPLAEESLLMQRALRGLRQDRDGAAVLAALDEYRTRFPSGELAHEAERTRAQALLSLGRHREALAVLDAMDLAGSGKDVALLSTRGQLRVEAGRCTEAIGDFTEVLDRVRGGTAAEPALFARATCRARLGDGTGARADLDEYLDRFPAGRFADQASAARQGR